MIILAIDTSTSQGSVALLEDGAIVFDEEFQAGRSHSSLLFGALERVLSVAPKPDMIAIGLGPGSYAGARIAISAAIGLSLATGATLVGLPSIVALEDGEYVALGDARRESFYFAHVQNGECVEGPLLLSNQELLTKLSASADLPLYASETISVVPGVALRYPSAKRLARLAAGERSIFARGNLEPIYLRPPHITQSKAIREPIN